MATKNTPRKTSAKKAQEETSLGRDTRVNPMGDDVSMTDQQNDVPAGGDAPVAVAVLPTLTSVGPKGGGSGATSADPKLTKVACDLLRSAEVGQGFWFLADGATSADDRLVIEGNTGTIADKLRRAVAGLLGLKPDQVTTRTGRIPGEAKDSTKRHLFIGRVAGADDAPAPVEVPATEAAAS